MAKDYNDLFAANIHRDLPDCGCGVGRVWGGPNFNGHSRDCAYRIGMVRALEEQRKYESYLEAEATIDQRFCGG